MSEVKVCNKCNRELPRNSDYFHVSKNKKDGLASNCKECSKGRFTRFHELKNGEMFCSKCDKILPYTEEYFPLDKSAKNGLRKTCLICSGRKSYGKRRKITNKKPQKYNVYNKKLTIEDVYEFCESIKGICKSIEYRNNRTELMFECSTCKKYFNKTFRDYQDLNTPECGECSRKTKVEKSLIERSVEYIRETLAICEEIGLKLISENILGVHSDIKFECSRCEEDFNRTLSVLRISKSSTCHPCSQKIVAENRRYTLEEIAVIFEDAGCKLTATSYENNKQKLEYICSCGDPDEKALSNFLNGQRCKKCGIKKQADSKRTPFNEVEDIFRKNGCTLLSTEFIHSNIPLDYICECGNPSRIKLPAFERGVRCRKCFALRNSGENNANWNSSLTQEDRENARAYPEYVQWRKSVYERDNYTCQCCGEKSKSINAHHKDSFNWCVERRLDITNGETLCEHCHCLGEYSFHQLYGFGDNTETQYKEWLEVYRELNIESKYGNAE